MTFELAAVPGCTPRSDGARPPGPARTAAGPQDRAAAAPARRLRSLLALTALALGGCTSMVPPRPVAVLALPAPAWVAPLPHGGEVGALQRWWTQFDDPLLAELVQAAQAASPTLSAAGARIAQARAAGVAAGAARGPLREASAGLSRGRTAPGVPGSGSASAALQAGWEIDLFGARAAAADAATARLESVQAGWHEARVSVAAETGSIYLNLRACEAQLRIVEQDSASRTETARLTEMAARGGLQSRAAADLSRASAAQSRAAIVQQRTGCEMAVKALVVLTDIAEPALRERLAARRAQLPQPAALAVAQVPAAALAQRPDLYAAERDVVAASADVAQADAQRLPRIGLSGSLGGMRSEFGGVSSSGTTWNLGPLAISMPIFDGGARRADAAAARARYEAAVALYAARLRNAVREVEEGLLSLQSSALREPDLRAAAEGYERSYRAVETRQRAGVATLFELEDARRTSLIASSVVIEMQRERVASWIALYRSLGGGWSADLIRQASL